MFFITVSNGLLEGKHRKRIGTAIWEFMWLLDRITKIDDEGNGWILGGKPVQLKEMANGVSESQVSRNIRRLVKQGYVFVTLTPYGMRFIVANAKKRFSQNTKMPQIAKEVEPVKVADDNEPMSLTMFVEYCNQSKQRHINIIGSYADVKKPEFTTKAQWKEFLKRNLRPARALVPFTDEQIQNAAIEIHGADWIKRWTLETIEKFLIK